MADARRPRDVSSSNEAPPAKKAKREKVGVGVGVVVTKGRPRVANGTVSDFRILVGLRKGSHGAGQWALPGGWLEKGEEFIDCALRELKEETGIAPSDADLPTRGESKARAAGTLPFVANNTQLDGVHSVTVFCYVKLKDAKTAASVEEPDKCAEWRWCSREELADLPPTKSRQTGMNGGAAATTGCSRLLVALLARLFLLVLALLLGSGRFLLVLVVELAVVYLSRVTTRVTTSVVARVRRKVGVRPCTRL